MSPELTPLIREASLGDAEGTPAQFTFCGLVEEKVGGRYGGLSVTILNDVVWLAGCPAPTAGEERRVSEIGSRK